MGPGEHGGWVAGSETISRAFRNPLRVHILALIFREPTKIFSAAELKRALAGEFKSLRIAQVAYQLAQLQDAGLVVRSD